MLLLRLVHSGAIRDDEEALFLSFALCIGGLELLLCRRHLWSTLLWTGVGLLPGWILLSWVRISNGVRALLVVIGVTAAAFGLFLTYRRRP